MQSAFKTSTAQTLTATRPCQARPNTDKASRPCILVVMKERLQKYLSRCGVASRRRAEDMISQGKVAVNGAVVARQGTKVDPARDTVTVAGKPVSLPATSTYLALHKPPGYLATRADPYNRPTVFDLLPATYAFLRPVGRLDNQSEGLLFLTNDGAWANRVAHPRYGGEKEYAVLVNGSLTAQQCDTLRGPLTLDGYPLNPVAVELMNRDNENGTWISMTLTEGRKRQIRHMLSAIGKRAVRLIRVRIGSVHLRGLAPGASRPLTQAEIDLWHEQPQDANPDRNLPASHSTQRQARITSSSENHRVDTSFVNAAIDKKRSD